MACINVLVCKPDMCLVLEHLHPYDIFYFEKQCRNDINGYSSLNGPSVIPWMGVHVSGDSIGERSAVSTWSPQQTGPCKHTGGDSRLTYHRGILHGLRALSGGDPPSPISFETVSNLVFNIALALAGSRVLAVGFAKLAETMAPPPKLPASEWFSMVINTQGALKSSK